MAEKSFSEKVAEVVRAIPPGTTLSYGTVAMFAGRPGAPRAALRALGSTPGLPWWRVIRSDGTMAEQVAAEQGKKLAAEGAVIVGRRVHPPGTTLAAKPSLISKAAVRRAVAKKPAAKTPAKKK
jgi:methylated-DNA-protein-cysteine methyltransferase-like protein